MGGGSAIRVRLPSRLASLVVFSLITACRGSLVDVTLARGRGRGAYLKVAAARFDLALGSVLQDVCVIQRVTSVGDALYTLAGIGVIATTGYRHRLAGVPALDFLLRRLSDLCYGRHGGH